MGRYSIGRRKAAMGDGLLLEANGKENATDAKAWWRERGYLYRTLCERLNTLLNELPIGSLHVFWKERRTDE